MQRGKRPRFVRSRPTYDYCLTCRSSKVKCDSVRPICGRCSRLAIRCEGYGSWVVDLPDNVLPSSSGLGDREDDDIIASSAVLLLTRPGVLSVGIAVGSM